MECDTNEEIKSCWEAERQGKEARGMKESEYIRLSHAPRLLLHLNKSHSWFLPQVACH